MLTGFGKATVGGAQAVSVSVSVCGRVTGSLEYTAPEQLRGGEIGPAADMWSLGMVLYVCVEGDTAMRRDWAGQRLSAVREHPPPPMTRAGALTPVIATLLDGELCAWTPARAHARTGDRIAIASYLGDDAFTQAIDDFSAAYAEQNALDFAALD
jgi:serine/threonine protein kinase